MDPIEIRTIDITSEGMPLQVTPARASRPAGECPQPTDGTHVYFERCEEAKAVDLGEAALDEGGRVLDVTMTLKNVCPCKRTAVGVALSEVDAAGNEYARGFKCVTVPAHRNASCCDLKTPRMRFILPEDLRVDGATGICNGRRHLILRATTHYVDTGVTMR